MSCIPHRRLTYIGLGTMGFTARLRISVRYESEWMSAFIGIRTKRTEGVADVEPDEDWCRRFIPHHWSAKRGVGLQIRKLAHFTPIRGSQSKIPC
jgi:hypothetical protein